MLTKSYISAAALAAALFAGPQPALAQGLNLGLGGVSVDSDVDIGGNNLVEVDAAANLGGEDGLDVNAGADVGGSGSSLDPVSVMDAEVDLGIGPNGGTLIDLGKNNSHGAVLEVDVNVLDDTKGSSSLITGDIRIGSLGEGDDRTRALLGLIDSPNLSDIDLDTVVDDTRVSIVAAADLLGTDDLADIRAAVDLGGTGRRELLEALTASVELSAILGNEGIALEDVLAVQVADNGAAEIIVLAGTVEVAALGGDGNLADLTAEDLAKLDIDLLSRDKLAEIDLDLLPDDLRTTAQLRLLGVGGDAADVTPADLANVDLDLLSDDELVELDVDLLPGELAAAIGLRLLADDGNLADLSVGDLAAVDLDHTTGGDGATGTTQPGDNAADNSRGDPPASNVARDTVDDNAGGADNGNSGNDRIDTLASASPGTVANRPATGALPATQIGAALAIAALSCDIGTLALANGANATPQAIAGAATLELVRIDGCERRLVDADVDEIRAAISANPVISGILDDAAIPLDDVIGATIQGGTLTLFIDPAVG